MRNIRIAIALIIVALIGAACGRTITGPTCEPEVWVEIPSVSTTDSTVAGPTAQLGICIPEGQGRRTITRP
jgi:hypothetical protein